MNESQKQLKKMMTRIYITMILFRQSLKGKIE